MDGQTNSHTGDSMAASTVGSVQFRANAKLRYAAVHLEELRSISKDKGGDFARAHQESFLYHLLGVKDAFLNELNYYYGCGLNPNSVTLGNLRNQLESEGRSSSELEAWYTRENNPQSWLHKAIAMRHRSTHVEPVPLTHNLGGASHGQAWLADLKTGIPISSDYVILFESWHSEMTKLVTDLRQSALKATGFTV